MDRGDAQPRDDASGGETEKEWDCVYVCVGSDRAGHVGKGMAIIWGRHTKAFVHIEVVPEKIHPT